VWAGLYQLSSPDVARIMEKRSVLYAPDYVVNVGGAMAILGMETQGWSKERAEEEVALAVRMALKKVLE